MHVYLTLIFNNLQYNTKQSSPTSTSFSTYKYIHLHHKCIPICVFSLCDSVSFFNPIKQKKKKDSVSLSFLGIYHIFIRGVKESACTEPTPTATDTGTKSQQIPNTSSAAAASSTSAAADTSTIAKAGNSDVAKSYPLPAAEYEEVVENVDMFMQTLLDLHRHLGTKFMVPTMGGKTVDLHRLFVEVTSRGGLEKVISDRKWRDVIDVFCFPATITNASFVLRKYYLSLLHDYEQVYYFRRHGSLTSVPVSVAKCPARGSASSQVQANGPPSNKKGSSVIESPASDQLQVGCTVSGIIDGNFDNGYFVTFNVGSKMLRGVLYHVPDKLRVPRGPTTSIMSDRPNRKRSATELKDPARPKLRRSGYNFSFADNYPKLMSSYHEQEKAISKEIEQLWSELTEDEKQSVNVIWSFTQGRAGEHSMTSTENIQKGLSGAGSEGQGELPK